MYCTNCGRKLPEDGSPCVCRRQPAQPEQQTYTQPVQPQQNYGAPTQNFQMPPQYYAQPPVQYPVQRPITPVHGVLKSFFASPLFLITAILFSVNLLFQIIASLFPQDPAYIVNQIYSNLPYEMQFIVSPGDLYSALSDAQSGTTVGTVIGMLITGGLMAAAYWITYISAKNPSVPAAKTAGLTIMKVFSIISLVVLSLAEVLCVVLAVIFGVALAGNDYGYMDEMMSGFFIILIAACIIGFVVLIFEIIYEAKVIKMLNSAKNAMLTGMVPNKASMFVAVICFISAAVSFFSVFGDAVLYGWIRVPLGLTSVALNVLYGLLVLQFNKMLKNAGMAR